MAFIWNIYEKSFTPYFARLAPKHLVHRHIHQTQPNKLSLFMRDPKSKSMMRFVRRYILQNTKIYHFLIIVAAFFYDEFWKRSVRAYYFAKNREVSNIYIFIFILIA